MPDDVGIRIHVEANPLHKRVVKEIFPLIRITQPIPEKERASYCRGRVGGERGMDAEGGLHLGHRSTAFSPTPSY